MHKPFRMLALGAALVLVAACDPPHPKNKAETRDGRTLAAICPCTDAAPAARTPAHRAVRVTRRHVVATRARRDVAYAGGYDGGYAAQDASASYGYRSQSSVRSYGYESRGYEQSGGAGYGAHGGYGYGYGAGVWVDGYGRAHRAGSADGARYAQGYGYAYASAGEYDRLRSWHGYDGRDGLRNGY